MYRSKRKAQYKARPNKKARMYPRRSTAVTVAAVKRSMGEKKGMDTVLDISTPVLATSNTNGDAFVLNLIQSGSDSWNRVGRKVNLKSVRLRGRFVFKYDPAGTTLAVGSNCVRMVVVWDKQPSGAAIPAFDAIFGHTDQSGTESTGFTDAVRYDNMDRFVVLRDIIKDCNPDLFVVGGTLNTATKSHAFEEFINLGGRECVFSGQTSPMTIADISTGALYVYFRAVTSSDEDNEINVLDSIARLRYTDI